MKYFMRITSFRQPEAFVDASNPIPRPPWPGSVGAPGRRVTALVSVSSQLFNQPAGSQDAIDPFPSYDRAAIVDQRDIGRRTIGFFSKFASSISISTSGPSEITVRTGVRRKRGELSGRPQEDFVNYRIRPIPGVLGEYGIGYAFVRSPVQGPFGYGPGEFDAALELINFRVYETGYISVRMVFIANRPTRGRPPGHRPGGFRLPDRRRVFLRHGITVVRAG